MATVEQLKAAAKELNKILDLDPAIVISGDPKKADLEAAIKEAAKLIEEGDKVSDKTKSVFTELKCMPKALIKKEVTNRAVYKTFMIDLVKTGKYTAREIVEKTAAKFPESSAKTMSARLSHAQHTKWHKVVGWDLVVKDKEGRLRFKK